MTDVINFYEKFGAGISKKYINPNKFAPQHPFRAILVGSSGAGKSNVVLNIIRQCACFDKIWLVSTNSDELLYQELEEILGNSFVVIDDFKKLPKLPNSLKTKKDKEEESDESEEEDDDDFFDKKQQKLIIFEDCLAQPKSVLKAITDYFIRGRHNNFSCIFTSQSFFDIPKNIRLNCNYIFLFGNIPSTREIKSILSLVGGSTSKIQLEKMFECAVRDGFPNFFMIDLATKNPSLKFRKNFKDKISLK